ncbi:hypothetical protein HGRIS_006529 [Hohenbuehelia grisea]|uniref:Uncharacterized protein n=1 Tax=Hohenbuehelia grisea TaxID=104357 RepID=A0ABR3J9B7_9AGAR
MVYAAALAPALNSSGAGLGGALGSAGGSVANRFFSRRSACNDCEPRQGRQGKVVIDGIDANGMLNVSASNKTLCKFDRTIITDDKDRSSNEEIGSEGEATAAKNGLESYAYNFRNLINDEKLSDKFDAGNKPKLVTSVNASVFLCSPIMHKLYAAGGGAPGGDAPTSFPGGAGDAEDSSNVEGVD